MRLTSGVSVGCKHVDAALCDPIKVKTPIGVLSLLYATAAAAESARGRLRNFQTSDQTFHKRKVDNQYRVIVAYSAPRVLIGTACRLAQVHIAV